MTQIANALGIPSGNWVFHDMYNANLVCKKLAYSRAASRTFVISTVGCGGKKIHAWSKKQQTFIEADACNSALHLTSVTCQDQQTGSCPCASTVQLDRFSANNMAAANELNINFKHMAGSRCLTPSGQILPPSSSTCPFIYNDAVERSNLCRLVGYSTVDNFTQDSYTSPGNNSVAKWNSGKNLFDIFPSSSNNKIIDTIQCSNPVLGACSNWY